MANILLKGVNDSSSVELLEIIASILKCEFVLIEGKVRPRTAPKRPKSDTRGRPRHPKRAEIIASLQCGYGHRNIARQLGVPPSTVDRYAQDIANERTIP